MDNLTTITRPVEPLTVLLVEPDGSTAGVLSSWLQERGYAVAGVVARGEDALAVATASRPGAVILDASLSCQESLIRTGLEIRDGLGIPVLLVTAVPYDMLPSAEKTGLSPQEVLEKPFSPECLAAAVEAVITHRRSGCRRRAWDEAFQRAADTMPDLIMTLDARCRIRHINLPGALLAGSPRVALAGQKAIGTILPLSGRNGIGLRQCFDEERGFVVVADGIPIGGCCIPIRWTCEPVRDLVGYCIGWVCFGTGDGDAPVLAPCLEKGVLQRLDENVVQLATLNDRIRNPLQVIAAFAELVDGDARDMILSQVEAINGVVRQLDRGGVESAAVREYLRKHRGISVP